MSTDLLEHLAGRVSADARFLACALDRAQIDLGLSDLGLARRLGCAVEALTDLRLCRMPRDAGEVAQSAGRFGCHAQALAEVLAGCGTEGPAG